MALLLRQIIGSSKGYISKLSNANIFKLRTIKQKFSLVILVITVLVLTVSICIKFKKDVAYTECELQYGAESISNLAALSLSEPLWNYNYDGIKAIGDALFKNKYVGLVQIEDRAGNQLYKKRICDPIYQDAYLLIAEKDVMKDQEKLGIIKLGITAYFFEEKINKDLINNIIEMAIMLAILWLIICKVSHVVTKPLMELSTGTEELAKGNLNKRIAVYSQDEIGKLAVKFNSMAENLEDMIEKREQAEKNLKVQAGNMRILNQIIIAANSAKDLSSLLDKVLGSIMDFWGFAGGSIYLTDKDQNVSRIVCMKGFALDFIGKLTEVSIVIEPYATVLSAGEPVFFEKDYHDEFSKMLAQYGYFSFASIPLASQNKIIGCINLACIDKHIFSLEEKALLCSIGHEIGNVIEKMQIEDALRDSEEKFRALAENSIDAIMRFDCTGRYLYVNSIIENYTKINKDVFIGKNSEELGLPHELVQKFSEAINRVMSSGNSFQVECQTPNSAWVEWQFVPEYTCFSTVKSVMVSGRDITKRKKLEKQLTYMGMYDSLTDLYNRTYFNSEMQKIKASESLPLGIIVCDLDGLKLVNDTMGHDKGDKMLVSAAGILSKLFSGNEVLARIGGDEFAALLPNTSLSVLETRYRMIMDAVELYNAAYPEVPLSISVGFAIRESADISITETFKEADNQMYREKLHRSKSARSAIVQTLMKALEARDFITEEHADRLQDLVTALAGAIHLPERKVADLRLLAQFHDIGKVGIPDRILLKPDRLTQEEFLEMQRHCEIGHRIAQSAPDLLPITDWILKHHECWDGGGYPLGLKKEAIPLECRILAIADAYDAMVSDRPYRKAMLHEQAITELKRCAGTQFDPNLVDRFIKMFEEYQKA